MPFIFQVADVVLGSPAFEAKNGGKLRIGDFLLAVDGWSTSQKYLEEVCRAMVSLDVFCDATDKWRIPCELLEEHSCVTHL